MNPESIVRRPVTTKENSFIARSLSGSASIIQPLRPIEFQKMGQFHFTSLYKPLGNLVLEIISFILLIPVLLICCMVLLLTGKCRAFALWASKKK